MPVMTDLGKSQFGDEGGGGGGGVFELGPGGGCVDRGSKKQMERYIPVLFYLPGSNLISIYYVSVPVQAQKLGQNKFRKERSLD